MKDWQRKQAERFAKADREDINYDYFKSMVSLSILTIGGILTIGESLFADVLSQQSILIAAGLVAIAGVIAFQAQYDILRMANGYRGGSWWLRLGHVAAPLSFGGGVGTFLAMIASGKL
ncbi:hypothetical protein OAS19_05640 [Altererythrobacter sp.]|nr:hypothetical protein [Altererythrobacter sp.]